MKILLINGSPKGKRSNSLRLAESFIDGVRTKIEGNGEQVAVEKLDVASLNIRACLGCFSCWKNTPGVCCIKDDMQMVIQKLIEANMVVWSFPLYYFNVPGMLKNLIDRQLPMNLPFMSKTDSGYGSGGHDSRYDLSGVKHILISTCGFYSAEGNYDSVRNMFDHFLGKGRYETIFCGQGELFGIKELASRTDEYLSAVKKAGSEYATGTISDEVKTELKTLLYPRDVFEKMADASWGVSKTTGEKEPEDLIFTRQMAALYNKSAYDGKDRVLEMNYTDLGTTYQILLGKDGSKVFTDGSQTVTTRVNTPYDVWAAISRGEMEGAEALGNQLYTVTGDFSLMMNWDQFFGSTANDTNSSAGGAGASRAETASGSAAEVKKNPSMNTMLIPWITFWVAVAINAGIGSVIAMAVCALVPLIMRHYRLIIWDRLSLAAVAVLSAVANITGYGDLITNIGYLVFGIFWLGSCFTREPLCAAYVKYSYGGEKALKNPLFMKANYILAACWGILYVLTAVWTFFLRKAGFGTALIVVNNIVPLVMGAFTVWFSKWYPAWKASGK